ncbi:MAG: hypothetical protein HRU18_03795 [Pseudoalteromonas sp.]|uniref:hypothetical protein n=1 Tax=Pseudoalteromonas sp. TaxID=53249 RepID=UPI001D7BC05D|nr:hypothetical protein [Pseudoalteromonas sp.]NRA77310.1 hypothetical protein [Pseudoalteromonas sp.]
MEIKLGRFRIFNDSISFALEETYKFKDKKGVVKDKVRYWYFPRLQQCLMEYHKQVVMTSDISSIEELSGVLSGIEESIRAIPDVIFKAEDYK